MSMVIIPNISPSVLPTKEYSAAFKNNELKLYTQQNTAVKKEIIYICMGLRTGVIGVG